MLPTSCIEETAPHIRQGHAVEAQELCGLQKNEKKGPWQCARYLPAVCYADSRYTEAYDHAEEGQIIVAEPTLHGLASFLLGELATDYDVLVRS